MAHNIFGERFLGRREKAWHGLGQVFQDPITATEAVSKAGIGFEIEKLPVFAQRPDGTKVGSELFALVRQPVPDDNEHRVLGVVSKWYQPIQAMDLAKILDPITEKMPVETAGALGRGETIFLTLNAGKGTIGGEDAEMFYLVTDSRDGEKALRMLFTPVRVVCQNTLTAGINQAVVSVSLPHGDRIADDAKFYAGLMAKLQGAREKVLEQMEALAAKKVSTSDARAIIRAAYPTPAVPQRLQLREGVKPDDVPAEVYSDILKYTEPMQVVQQQQQDRVVNLRGAAWDLFVQMNDQFPKVGWTAWSAWNAVVELEDYREGKGNVAQSAVFGPRAQAKARAFAVALKV